MSAAAGFFDEPRIFRAKTPKAALAAVKAALGPDAIIMSCEEVRKTLFGQGAIEVTARGPNGLDTSALMAETPASAAPEAPSPPERQPALRSVGPTTNPLARAGRAFGFAPQRAGSSPAPKTRAASIVRAVPPLDEESDGVNVFARLTELGIDHVLARELDTDLSPQLDDDALMYAARRALRKAVTLARAPWTPDPTTERSVIALVGPTGAGKTTTAAKIAARAMMERGLDVALITIDHYRVGAADQLVRYGELMGVPVMTASDPASFTRALDATTRADLVIVDTAGRSPHDHQVNAQQAAMLRLCPELERILVVPATFNGKPLARVQERFFAMALDRLIVSKADEGEGPSAVLSIAARLGLPLAAVCDGQNVTDDLRRVHWDWLLEAFERGQS